MKLKLNIGDKVRFVKREYNEHIFSFDPWIIHSIEEDGDVTMYYSENKIMGACVIKDDLETADLEKIK